MDKKFRITGHNILSKGDLLRDMESNKYFIVTNVIDSNTVECKYIGWFRYWYIRLKQIIGRLFK